jgi:hypothetical protein
MFQSTWLVSISISDTCNFPISILCICPQLKVLSLRNVVTDIEKRNTFPSSPNLQNGQLIHLDISLRVRFTLLLIQCLHHPSSALGMDRLRVFIVSFHDESEINPCQQVIDLSAATIEELRLHLNFVGTHSAATSVQSN